MSAFHTVCQTNEVPVGEGRMFVVNEKPVGVFNIEGEFHAIANQCPHAGASLAGGIIEGSTVRCRIHHWRFCISTGTYIDEDKPRYNARTYAVRVVGDEVQVEL